MATSTTSAVLQHLLSAFGREGAGVTDGELLNRFLKQRDDAALAALVRRHASMVWGVCRRLLRSHHDAEDAFQATFLVLVRKAAAIRHKEMVANWLYGVAHQTSVRLRARAAKRGVRERQVVNMPEPVVAEVRGADLVPLLDQELSRLPEKFRVLIVLCDLESKTRKEVARQLGCPEGTVASRLARARALLAKRLAQQGVVLSVGALAAVLAQNVASAGVPTAVVSLTIKAASLFAAGQAAAAGVISAEVAALTEGVLKAMFMTKLKTVMSVVMLLGTVAFGGGLLMQRTAAGQPGQAEKSEAQGNTLGAIPAHQQDASSKIGAREPPTAPAKDQDDAKKMAEIKDVHEKMRIVNERTSEKAADFEYPEAKKLDQRAGNAGVADAGSVYQSLCTTTDDLSKVVKWYDKKLASLIAGQPAGVEGEPDGTRRAINQDGDRPDLDPIAKRPVSTRSYLVRTKQYTVSVVISRPPGEALTVISLTSMPA